MAGLGHAHGKLLLFGEHAAVHGWPAVGVSLPETLEARLSGAPRPAWDLGALPGEDRAPVLEVLASIEAAFVELTGLPAPPRCTVSISSNIPRGSGFGSSAALCGALSRALLEHAGRVSAETPEAWRLAHAAERRFHGTPSGVDTGLSLLGGVLGLQPRLPDLPSFERLEARGLVLVVGAVPRDAACGALIAELGARMRKDHLPTRDALTRLGEIAGRARIALRAAPPQGVADAAGALAARVPAAGLAAALGALADQAMSVLQELGLGTPDLDRVLDAGRAAGAIGGKLSGGGGGGAFYLVAPTGDAAHLIAKAVNDAARSGGTAMAAPARAFALGGDA